MQITLEFHSVKPINLNNCQKITAVGRHPRKYKTKEYQQFESVINTQIRCQSKTLGKINKHYNFERHALEVEYTFMYDILTKKGLISQRSQDVDNIIKPINDVIFKHLCMDDSQVIKVTSTKKHSIVEQIEVKIKIVPLAYAS